MLLAAAAASALAGCTPRGGTDEATDNGADTPILNLPSIPDPAPAMDREALLAAVARAASAAFAGSDDLQQQRALDGSPFELRIRFGCGGPDPAGLDSGLGWAFDEKDRALRLRARPTVSDEDPTVKRIVAGLDDGIEAVEGFWIPRPWLLEPACPAGSRAGPGRVPADPDGSGQAAVPAGADGEAKGSAPASLFPKVGIAQFFTEAEPRTRRRQARAYETVKTIRPDERPGASGFDLVLSGRLRSLPGGRVIACVPAGPDAPPNCLASAHFDKVRIERAGSGDVIAQWETG